MSGGQLNAVRIIAILRGLKPVEALDIGHALFSVGIGVIEVPLNSPSPFQSIAALAETFKDRALIGAGTVVDPAQVSQVKAAGGRLVVSPNSDPAVIKATKEAGLVSVPGFATPTEAFTALRAGADALKMFPAGSQGPEGLKALMAVLPADTPVFAVGGVGPENMRAFAAAGASGFGLGTSLYRPGSSAGDVAKNAASTVAACQDIFG
ncbi:MAG: 2-dehydro-3-deoxy-6-phosphogalactonate aldolase [Sphingomonadales bacterium]|nr:2-dehydro-3-deoxy-6-phosphogalactonate aldolase [Sphingomonadales bacterium]